MKTNIDYICLLEKFFTDYLPISKGVSKNTIRSYKSTFRLLSKFMFEMRNISATDITFNDLTIDTIADFLKWVEEDRSCSVATRNIRRTALASFAEYAQNRNIDAAMYFSNALKRTPVKKQAAPPRTFFTLEEVTVLLSLPNRQTAIGYRDLVLLNLMYACGTRAQEVCDIRVGNFQFDGDDTAKLVIVGKGGKARRINVAMHCVPLLKEYLRHKGIENKFDSYIFSSQTHECMSIACVEEIFKKYIAIAREKNPLLFRGRRYSPHIMRHTTATHMLEAGVPLMVIKNFLGHSSVATTEKYAELTQSTVNKHIIEWNQRWFSNVTPQLEEKSKNAIPYFLN